ncbi:MAG: type IV secretion system DNA-binding domain-containing protein [Robiginitomaculum sp.]|nr:type IV secretion system DNA-binding domain-containing protein [Robiginitomaculum sp.]
MEIYDSFHQVLNDWLQEPLTPKTNGDIKIGEMQLKENPALVLELSEKLERVEGWLTFTAFQKLFQSKLQKPIPPQETDPIFDPSNIKYESPNQRQIAVSYRYKKALQEYEKRYARYTQISEESRTIVSNYRADIGGYLEFVETTLSSAAPVNSGSFFFEPWPVNIHEAARKRHTFLTGGTGSGKSEALKLLIRHYETKQTDTALVILDPHGKLAHDVALFAEHQHNDRLVYIDPNLSSQHTPVLNAFEVSDKSVSSLETQSAQLMAAMEQVLAGFTLNMESLLLPCLTVLLHRDGSDLSDLVRFMDKGRNRDLVNYGIQHLPFDEHRIFFETQFFSQHFDSTKEALRNRFQSLINIPTIKQFTCGSSTFDLESLIDQKKIIVFNLSISGAAKNSTRVIGQFITALVQSYAMRREQNQNNPKTPIHFFADECQYFVSRTTDDILGESRKYGLFLTLATQRTEQVGGRTLDAILGNAGLFLVGKNRGKTVSKMSKELDIEPNDIRSLPTGSFYLSQSGRTCIRTKLPLVGQKYAMKAKDWEKVRQEQLDRYYRQTNKVTRQHSSGKAASTNAPKPKLSFPEMPPIKPKT